MTAYILVFNFAVVVKVLRREHAAAGGLRPARRCVPGCRVPAWQRRCRRSSGLQHAGAVGPGHVHALALPRRYRAARPTPANSGSEAPW